MQNMWKIVGGVVALVLIIVLGTRLMQPNVTDVSAKPTIKIGVSAPLTGNVAFLGEGMRNAVTLAKESLPGELKYNYEFVIEDDGFEAKRQISSINKLINIDQVDAFATLASGAGNIATPIAEGKKVIHIGIASDPSIAKGEYNFIHWTPPAEEAKLFVSELQKRGLSRVAMLGANIQGITAVMDEVEKQVQGTNIQIVSKDIFNFGEKDFRTLIAKAKATNPDVYVPVAFSPELEIVAKQLQEAGITQPITTLESFELTDQPQLFEGKWYVNAADSSEAFRSAYSKRFSKEPALAAANTYDIVNLIVRAAESAETAGATRPTTEQIKNALYQVKISDGALGNLTVNSDGFVVTKAVVRMIKDGKPMTVK